MDSDEIKRNERRLKEYRLYVTRWEEKGVPELREQEQVKRGLETILADKSAPPKLIEDARKLQEQIKVYFTQRSTTPITRKPVEQTSAMPNPVPTRQEQRRPTSINIGDHLKVERLQRSNHGTDYVVPLVGAKIFVTEDPRLSAGWKGTITITARNPRKDDIYYARADLPSLPERPVQKPAPSKYVEPVKTTESKKETPKNETGYILITLGDLGATTEDRAVIKVPKDATELPIKDAIPYILRAGQPTTSQGQSVLEAMRKHIQSGRPIYRIGKEVPDPDMQLGHYLGLHSRGELEITIGEKAKEVRPPAAAEVITPSKKRHEPMPIGIGSRRHGATLDGIVYKVGYTR
jgi:hypothetical protein